MFGSLKGLDYFARPIELKMNGQKNYPTFIGVFFTFLWIGIIIAIAVYEIVKMTDMKDPTVSREPVNQDQYFSADIGQLGFLPLIVAYRNDDMPLPVADTAKYFTAYIQQTTWKSSYSQEKDQLQVKREVKLLSMAACAKLNSSEKAAYSYISNSSFLSQALPRYGLCPAGGNNSLRISGKATDPLFETVSLVVKPCLLDSGCATAEEVAEISFQLLLPGSTVDMQDNKKPHRYFLDADDIVHLNPAVRQKYSAKVGRGEIREYSGAIPSWKHLKFYYEVRDMVINAGFRDSQLTSCTSTQAQLADSLACTSYFEYSLQSSGLQITNKRKYNSLLDVFATIGGIQSTVALIILLIYSPINNYYRTQHLVKKVYPLLLNEKSIKEAFEDQKRRRAEEKKRIRQMQAQGNGSHQAPYIQINRGSIGQVPFPSVAGPNYNVSKPQGYRPVTRITEVPRDIIDDKGEKHTIIEYFEHVEMVPDDHPAVVQSPMIANSEKREQEDTTPKHFNATEASPESRPLKAQLQSPNYDSRKSMAQTTTPLPSRVNKKVDDDKDDDSEDGPSCFKKLITCAYCCKKKGRIESEKKDPNWFERWFCCKRTREVNKEIKEPTRFQRWFCCKKTKEEEDIAFKNKRLVERIDDSVDVVNMVRDFNFTKIMVHYLFDNRHFSTAQHAGFELWRQEKELKKGMRKIARKELKAKGELGWYNRDSKIKEKVKLMELDNFFDSISELKHGLGMNEFDIFQYDSQSLDGFFQDSVYKKKKRTTIIRPQPALTPVQAFDDQPVEIDPMETFNMFNHQIQCNNEHIKELNDHLTICMTAIELNKLNSAAVQSELTDIVQKVQSQSSPEPFHAQRTAVEARLRALYDDRRWNDAEYHTIRRQIEGIMDMNAHAASRRDEVVERHWPVFKDHTLENMRCNTEVPSFMDMPDGVSRTLCILQLGLGLTEQELQKTVVRKAALMSQYTENLKVMIDALRMLENDSERDNTDGIKYRRDDIKRIQDDITDLDRNILEAPIREKIEKIKNHLNIIRDEEENSQGSVNRKEQAIQKPLDVDDIKYRTATFSPRMQRQPDQSADRVEQDANDRMTSGYLSRPNQERMRATPHIQSENSRPSYANLSPAYNQVPRPQTQTNVSPHTQYYEVPRPQTQYYTQPVIEEENEESEEMDDLFDIKALARKHSEEIVEEVEKVAEQCQDNKEAVREIMRTVLQSGAKRGSMTMALQTAPRSSQQTAYFPTAQTPASMPRGTLQMHGSTQQHYATPSRATVTQLRGVSQASPSRTPIKPSSSGY